MSPGILDVAIKFGPTICGLISFFALAGINHRKNRKNNLGDLLVVGLAGSSVPTGVLLIYGAFNSDVIPRLSDAGIYIAFAGAALLIIFGQTFREKA
ncbi:conserved membrane protein of unknown function [Ectopseudomonas oleovorans]|uniref:Uncharacterized protein n=1 Tax=Ectopseudomonas oleovorans TaxID=301 RepID=A0A653B7P8_ECTOL|nr:conserved membrane protein of unknown function [Pseudomonas oleovorans]